MAAKILSVVKKRVLLLCIAVLLLAAAVAGIVMDVLSGGAADISVLDGSHLVGGVVVSVLLAGAFFWFRFKLSRAAAGLIALAYDVILVVGFLAWMGYSLSPAVLAAVVGVAFLSLQNSTVLFDRIRERVKATIDVPFAVTVDTSVTSSVGRNGIVSSAVIVLCLVLALLIPEGNAHDAALTLIAGAVLSSFTAVFVTPLLVFLLHKTPLKHVKAPAAIAADTDKAVPEKVVDFSSSPVPVAERKMKGKRRESRK